MANDNSSDIKKFEKEFIERKKEMKKKKWLIYENYTEIEKIKKGKMEYIVKIFGAKESFWYGIEIPFKVELVKGYEKNLFENLKVQCLVPFLHHPAVSLDGQCAVRNNCVSSFKSMFGTSLRPLKRITPEALSFIESLTLLFSIHPSVVKFANQSEWDPSVFASQRLCLLTLWSPERHSYFGTNTIVVIETLVKIFFLLKKQSKKVEPNSFKFIINLPKNLFFLLLGFVGRAHLIDYTQN